ncbi:MAG: hypothetical protein IPP90_02650 [Gemmatimonadaceae bacterium]|nr:hypothetical protein [Gemmatimonadaceae bacterium]
MTIRVLTAALLLTAATASAQQPPVKTGGMDKAKMEQMDHSKMEQEMNHAMSPWKELDAYHMLMMATWHPAKDKGDLAPTRAKIGDMVASAKALAGSTAPKGCDSPKLKATAAALPAETQGVADLVAAKAEDGKLKDAMKALHEKFDVLEAGCVMPKKDGMK